MGGNHSTLTREDTRLNFDSLLSEEDEKDIEKQIEQRTSKCNKKCEDMRFDFLKDRDYPFENLVFEGGGSKGSAHVGGVKVLEELGILSKVKRFAGTSFGAIIATTLAVGYTVDEMETILRENISSDLLFDARCSFFSFLPNLIRRYGVHPGNKLYQYFGDLLEKKTGNPDVTFEQVYKMFNKELCLVMINVNNMREEYCHPKTTPKMSVRLALRMSVSYPGAFQPIKKTLPNGGTDFFVDGALICNYPVHCFDGWWLSMKPEDTFLKRIQGIQDLPKLLSKGNRFGQRNHKTLGFILTSDEGPDLFKYYLEDRTKEEFGITDTPIPDSKLAKEDLRKTIRREKIQEIIIKAVDEFIKVLKKHDLNGDGKIDMNEMKNVFADSEFSNKSKRIIFGHGRQCDAVEAFDLLDANSDGQVTFDELVTFVEQREGIDLQQLYTGYKRHEIDGVTSFFSTCLNAVFLNASRIFMEGYDIDRTVGINTGYVGSNNYDLEEKDIDFLLLQGRKSTLAYLKYYVEKSEHRINSESVFETVPLTPLTPKPTPFT
ncbi:uncharacterized protein LOC110462095 [Mizuhopecten yessoensis]|uniref:uncharacterized protein LOC110462095 n=1 Tax=Mizuhopecten yessoensis TaxID=6573 RepID=UPI000B45BA1B|nr:uncharacterized protein LOC110462095 [Mizuhopecten yessoensis]